MAVDTGTTVAMLCRLWVGTASVHFHKTVLCRHHFRCDACGSVQTELPTWYDEAYSVPGLHINFRAPTRAIKNWLAASTLLQALGFITGAKGVDFGAGPGLFTRLMRCVGHGFWAHGAYLTPMLSSGHYSNKWEGERVRQ